MLTQSGATVKTLFGQSIEVNGYFTSVLGSPALNMGVFVGIISGFVGGIAYNKYYNFRKLPDANSFTEILSSSAIGCLDRWSWNILNMVGVSIGSRVQSDT